MAGHVERIEKPNGSVRWRASFKYAKAGKLSRGSKTFERKRDADEWLSHKLAFKLSNAGGRKGTLAQYIETWLARRVATGVIRENTAQGYYTRLKHISENIGDIRLDRVTHNDLRDYLAGMHKAGLARSTINQARVVLNRALADAVVDSTLAVNPAAGLRIERANTRKDVVAPSPSEVRSFLSYIEKNNDNGRFFRLLASTGLRRSEAGGLTWAHVDLDNRVLRVRQALQRASVDGGQVWVLGGVKTSSARRDVPLSRGVIDLLQAQRHDIGKLREIMREHFVDRDLVFCNNDGSPLHLDALSAAARRARDALGLSPAIAGVHGLRHFAGTQMHRAGVDAKTIQATLGHSRISTTLDLYVTADADQSREALDGLDGLL